jgi:thymidylate synthase (FAD)
MYVKGSVRSWIHYCEVRRAASTQKEHREVADLVWSCFKEQFPATARAVENNKLSSETPEPKHY